MSHLIESGNGRTVRGDTRSRFTENFTLKCCCAGCHIHLRIRLALHFDGRFPGGRMGTHSSRASSEYREDEDKVDGGDNLVVSHERTSKLSPYNYMPCDFG